MLHTDEDVETLIDEYGLDAVVVTLMEMAATRPISIIQYRLQRGDKRLGYILRSFMSITVAGGGFDQLASGPYAS